MSIRAIGDLISQYADAGRRFRLARVVDASNWSSTGPAMITVELDGGYRQVVYRDGRQPEPNELVHVVQMNARKTSPWLALPILEAVLQRRITPYMIAAFDASGHFSPEDDEFAVILGCRDNDTWIKLSNMPLTSAEYVSIYGEGRENMRVRFLDWSTSVFRQVVWAYPDSPDDGIAVGINAYQSFDSCQTWEPLEEYPGLVDIPPYGRIASIDRPVLYNGGSRVGITFNSGSVPTTYFDMPDTYSSVGFFEQLIPADGGGTLAEHYLGLLNNDGLTIVHFIDGSPSSTLPIIPFRATTAYPKYGTLTHFALADLNSYARVFWQSGIDPHGGDAHVHSIDSSDLFTGSGTWVHHVDGGVALPVKPAATYPHGNIRRSYAYLAMGPSNRYVGGIGTITVPPSSFYAIPPDHPLIAPVYRGRRAALQAYPIAPGEWEGRNTNTLLQGPDPHAGSTFTVNDRPLLVDIALQTGTQDADTPVDIVNAEGNLRTAFLPALYVPYGEVATQFFEGDDWWLSGVF